MRWMFFSVVIGALTMAAAQDFPATNETAKFLGPEPGWQRCRVELRDVQGLFGGRDVFVEGTGRCVIRLVKGGRQERRFPVRLEPSEARAILAACVETDLLAIQVKERPGVPDEAYPTITLVGPSGLTRSIGKWANDKVEGFDPVLRMLRDLEKLAEGLNPEFEGDYRWEWRPWEGIEVTISMYSGRRDPTFDLVTPEDWDQVRKRLAGLPEGGDWKPPQLGYRGIVLVPREVPDLPRRIQVWEGTIRMEGTAGVVTLFRDEKKLEDWLLERAKERQIDVR